MEGRTSTSRSSGVTLVEMVVSVGIVALITGITLSALLSARRTSAVRQAAEQFAGFLRETTTLTVSGVSGPGCGTATTCYQYRVAGTGGASTYTRQTEANTNLTTRSLPGAVRFVNSVTFRFRSTPPTLSVFLDNNSMPLAPGASAGMQLRYGNSGTVWNVCVTGLGQVSASASTC